jgi:cold shock CspA family protein
MLNGRIVCMDQDREYGVVEDDRGHRWRFFEFSTPKTFSRLGEGQRVTFCVAPTRKRSVAADVTPIEETGAHAQ